MYLLSPLVLVPIVLATLVLQSGQPGLTNDRNLFEFSIVSYGVVNRVPSPGPPDIKVYESGRFVFREEDRYLEGRLAPNELTQLKKKLSGNRLLKTSQVVEVSRGMLPGLHGGFGMIRYLEGEAQVLLVFRFVPTRGPLANLLREVRSVRPKQLQPFRPDILTLITTTGFPETCPAPPEQNRVWPFGERVRLRTLLRNPKEFNDAAISRYLFPNGISSLSFDFCEDGDLYSLYVVGVAGWKFDGEQLTAGWEGQALMDESK